MGSPVEDIVPDNNHRIGYWIGRIFHPAVVMLPTLILVLSDVPLQQSLLWTAVIAAVILVPGIAMIAFLKRQQTYTYQRRSRAPLYVTGWFSVIVCWLLIWLFNGPRELIVCMATLAVWLPTQLAINHYITKVSTHTAVVAGCVTALIVLGKLNTPVVVITAMAIVVLTAWARVMTRNHTLLQVLLGLAVGVGSVLVVFPFVLGW